MKNIMTQRKLIYRVVAFIVIMGAWTYVLSEIYKYEMDTHYSMVPRRVDDVDSKNFLSQVGQIEVPEEQELSSELLFARSVY